MLEGRSRVVIEMKGSPESLWGGMFFDVQIIRVKSAVPQVLTLEFWSLDNL